MYEKFRNDFMLEIMSLPDEAVRIAVKALDRVAIKYEFVQKEVSLAIYGEELPDMKVLTLL